MSTSEVLSLIQEVVEKSVNGAHVYRGEPECYPKVSSTLYRLYEDVDAEHFDIEKVQKEILDKARRYTSAIDELEILAELQHHGGKTNLIDFTTDYHTALFFACDGFYNEDGRLILLREATEQGKVWQPRNPANRVIAQKSVFVQPSKGFVEPDGVIIIPQDLKQPILNHLRKYHGISTETIYNDLHGFIKNQGIHQSAYTEFFRGLTSSSKGDESKNKEEQQGHYARAITYYDAALKLNPNIAEAYYNRGTAKDALGRHEEALTDYDTAIKINPQDANAYYNRGTAKDALGRHEEALADYDAAIRINSQNANAYINRGNAKARLGLYEEALEDYDTAIRINPQDADAYYNRGTAKDALGRHEEAVADSDTAIRIDPQNANAYINRGNAKARLGLYEETLADYDEAIRLDPQYAVAYSNRGTAKDALGRPEEALADYDEAIRIDPQYANAYYNRGTVKGALGGHEEAMADYDEAIRINPQDADAYYNRGLAKQNLGRNEEARKDFQKCVTLAKEQGKTEFAKRVQEELDNLESPQEKQHD